MKKLKMICAIAIVVSAATVPSLVKTMGAQGTEPETVVVTITPNTDPDGPPTVDPEDRYVTPDQQVEWTCPTAGCNFTVVFTEHARKPFNGRIFDNGHAHSGRPILKSGKFKYSVIVNNRGSADPQIIIH